MTVTTIVIIGIIADVLLIIGAYFLVKKTRKKVKSSKVITKKIPFELLMVPHSSISLLSGPCIFCGYNGPGYWQELTHGKSCLFHVLAGLDKRQEMLKKLIDSDLKIRFEVVDNA